MNTLRIVSLEPWVALLGWTLLHFVWQEFVIAIAYAAARTPWAQTRERECALLAGLRGPGLDDGSTFGNLGVR